MTPCSIFNTWSLSLPRVCCLRQPPFSAEINLFIMKVIRQYLYSFFRKKYRRSLSWERQLLTQTVTLMINWTTPWPMLYKLADNNEDFGQVKTLFLVMKRIKNDSQKMITLTETILETSFVLVWLVDFLAMKCGPSQRAISWPHYCFLEIGDLLRVFW